MEQLADDLGRLRASEQIALPTFYRQQTQLRMLDRRFDPLAGDLEGQAAAHVEAENASQAARFRPRPKQFKSRDGIVDGQRSSRRCR
ncbi:MAG TPA: hypothetical protein VKV73_05845 [Chloroflexota bacterium]|nr:hypothetical protein [Chloroflexota bacterium]